MKLVAPAVKVAVAVALSLGVGGCDLVESVVCRPATLARLDARRQRSVVITADRCWEPGRGIHAEFREAARTVERDVYITTDHGDESHTFALAFAEGGDLVGVVETTAGQSRLLSAHDFAAPAIATTADAPKYEELARAYDQMVERLQREHPQLRRGW